MLSLEEEQREEGPVGPSSGSSRDEGRSRSATIERLLAVSGRPLLWIVLLVVSVLPTTAFLALAISPRIFGQGASYLTFGAFHRAFSGVELTGIRNSALIATSAAILSVVFAGVLAWIAQRTDILGARWIGAILWWVLLVPTYVVSIGWQDLLGSQSLLSQLGLVTPTLRNAFIGPVGVILVLAFTGTPFAYFAVSPAMSAMGKRYEEAARIYGASPWKTVRTIIPILAPAIFAAMTIVFAESLGDYGVASTLATTANIPVATTGIMNAIATFPTDFPMAAAIAWILVGTIGTVLWLQNRMIRRRSYGVLSGRSVFAQRERLRGRTRLLASFFLYGFIAVTVVVPAFGAALSTLLPEGAAAHLSNLSLASYTSLLHSQSLLGPIGVSLKMAAINATVTVIIGLSVAKVLTSPRAGLTGRLTDVVLVASVALPGLVLAAGFIFVFNLPLTVSLGVNIYGTMILLGLGYFAMALPSNTRVLLGPVSQLDGTLMQAGRVLGSGPSRSFRRCVLPLLAKSLVWAWLLTFASTFGELPISQMLAPTGIRTMSTAVLSSFQNSNIGAATAFSVVQMLIVMGVIAVVLGLFHLLAPVGWRNIASLAKR